MILVVEFVVIWMVENSEVFWVVFVFFLYCFLWFILLDIVVDYVLCEVKVSGNVNIRVFDDVKLKIVRCFLLIYLKIGEGGIEVVIFY